MPENDTSYSRFTFDERCEIQRLLDHRTSMGGIARELGVPGGRSREANAADYAVPARREDLSELGFLRERVTTASEYPSIDAERIAWS